MVKLVRLHVKILTMKINKRKQQKTILFQNLKIIHILTREKTENMSPINLVNY